MKLLFVCNNMHIGGIQKALANLLGEISDKYDVTLFLFYSSGELDIPENVKVICGNKFTKIMGMSQEEAKKAGLFTALWRSMWAVFTKIFGIRIPFSVLSRMQKLRPEYDVAISYMQNSAYKMFYGGCNEFVINSVKARRKISFVHCDFENYFGNNAYNRSYYGKFDKIACVSDSCKAVFDKVCPKCSDKTVSVHNCYDFNEMKSLSTAYDAEYTKDAVNLFTASRISEEKGIFRMFPIFAELKNSGIKFVWRIAGAGPLLYEAMAERDKYGLSDCVEFLGMLDNPYPYFLKSDLLLVPSYNEAAPMVYGEAAFFKLPIFTTDTTSAEELVKERGLGFVCENTDEAIKTQLKALLENRENILEKARETEVSNEQALKEFEDLIL